MAAPIEIGTKFYTSSFIPPGMGEDTIMREQGIIFARTERSHRVRLSSPAREVGEEERVGGNPEPDKWPNHEYRVYSAVVTEVLP